MADEIENNSLPTRSPERAAELAPRATEAARALVEAVRLVNAENATDQDKKKAREALKERLEAFLGEEPVLCLAVGEAGLSFTDAGGAPAAGEDASRMFGHGIREIRFGCGVTAGELEGLVETLGLGGRRTDVHDDLVTLVADRDFAHISISSVDEYEDGEQAQTEEIISQGDESDTLWEMDRFRERLARGLTGTLPGELAPPVPAGAAFGLPDDATQLFELAVIFLEIMDNEKDHGRYGRVVDSLGKALDLLFTMGAITHATELVRRLKGISFRTEHLERLAKVKALLGWASAPGTIERLGRYMSKGDNEAEQAGAYLKLFDKRVLPAMITLLETLTNRGARLIVEESIVVQCDKKGAALLPYLEHETSHVVASVVSALGVIDDPASIPALGGLLAHKDYKLRKEALRALANNEYGKATDYIASAMKDEDPGIRVQAAKLIVERAPSMAYGMLVDIVSDKKFGERKFDEKKSFYQLIGKSGGQRSVGFLSEKFKKGGLLYSSNREEDRACAAYGLAAAGGAEAKNLLKSELDSSSKALKGACTEGLRQMTGKK